MLIRLRHDQDLGACAAVLRQVHHSDGYPALWPADPGAWLSPAGSVAAWVAEVGGAVVGHVCLVAGAHRLDAAAAAAATGSEVGRLATLSRLFVDLAARGGGVGAALLDAVGEHAAGAGLQLVLDVVDDGGPAQRLYQRCGWHLVHQRAADWTTPGGERLPVRVYTAPPWRPGDGGGGVVVDQRDRAEVLGEVVVGGAVVVLRRALARDVPAIVGLLAEDPLGVAREAITGEEDLGEYQRAFEAIDADRAHLLVVADDGAHVVATMQVSFLPGMARRGALRAQVEAVRVRSDQRGRGLGQAMLTWAIEQARTRGCAMVQLTSDASRVGAHRFYQRLGFAASHTGFKLVL